MRVFVIEDSAEFRRRLLALMADIEGVEVVGHAAGAQEAIAAVQTLRPDLVLLDLQLAEGTGFQVLQAVKGHPAPLVVVITNYPEEQFRKVCLDAGADFFLDKATVFDELGELFPTLLAGETLP